MIFLGKKQNTTLYSIYHHEGRTGVPWAALGGGPTPPAPHHPRGANPTDSCKQTGSLRTTGLEIKGEKKGTRRCLSASALQTSVQSNVKNRGYNNRYEKNTLLYTLVSTLAEELTGAKYMSSRRLPTNDALEPSRMRPDSTELSRKP